MTFCRSRICASKCYLRGLGVRHYLKSADPTEVRAMRFCDPRIVLNDEYSDHPRTSLVAALGPVWSRAELSRSALSRCETRTVTTEP